VENGLPKQLDCVYVCVCVCVCERGVCERLCVLVCVYVYFPLKHVVEGGVQDPVSVTLCVI